MISGSKAVYLVFLLSLILGLLVIKISWDNYRTSTEAIAANIHSSLTNQITQNITKAEQSLNQLNALFSTFFTLTENQFLSITEQILKQQPYINRIAYIPHVARENLETFESEVNEEHFITFNIKEYNNNGELTQNIRKTKTYYPFLYIEPQTVQNVILLGFNTYSIEKFSTAIDHAVSTHKVTPLLVNLQPQSHGRADFWILKSLYGGFDTPEASDFQQRNNSGVLAYNLNMNKTLTGSDVASNFTHFDIVFINENKEPETIYTFSNKPEPSFLDYFLFTTGEVKIETPNQNFKLYYTQRLIDDPSDRLQFILIVSAILLLIILATTFSQRITNNIKHQLYLYKKIKGNEKILLHAQKIAHLGSWDFNIKDDILEWSEEVEKIFELDSSIVKPSYDAFINAVHPDDRHTVHTGYMQSVKNKTKFDAEYRLLMDENRIKHVHVQCETFYDNNGEPVNSSGTIHDITLRKEHEQKITHQAHFDALTGLPNRFLSMDRLSRLLSDAQRHEDKVAVLFLDLDNFKTINDTLGHEVGDNMLVKAAQRLRSIIRSGDTVGRLGGDEFIVLLGGLDSINGAQPVAESILDEFRLAFNIDGRELMLTTSIGISIFPDDSSNPSELLRNADSAMYHSKDFGRNMYSYFTESMNSEISRKLDLEEQLHGALNRGEFTVVYQPKYDIHNRQITGAEALLRWNNPVLGEVSPTEFIPIAEQTGLIIPIGLYVLKESLAQTRQWKTIYTNEFNIAVNISPRQFRDPNLVDSIKTAIHEANIDGDCLELEITEGVLMSGHAYIDQSLERINKLGVTIALDDFGTGYSSLSYLRKYPFDVIKIDRSFVNDITLDQKDRELINATIVMAHALHLKVVAEGVETQEQLAYLKDLDCDLVQGYYYSKPVSAEHLSILLRNVAA